MPENADFIRLTEMLLSRQDQQQQQLDRLAAVAEAQTETNRQLAETDRRLEVSLAKTDEILSTFGQVQIRILSELEKLTTEQVRANRVQAEFAERQDEFAKRLDEHTKRQDEFNIHFLEEIRHIKQDARAYYAQTAFTLQQYDERLRRLEDFMNGFQSAA